MNINTFLESLDDIKEKLSEKIVTGYANIYCNEMSSAISGCRNVSTANGLLKNKDILKNSDFSDELREFAKILIEEALIKSGVSQSRVVTLANRIELSVGLPEFKDFSINVDDKLNLKVQPEIDSAGSKGNNVSTSDYVVGAASLLLTVAGVVVPGNLFLKGAVIIVGCSGVAAKTYKIVKAKTKSSDKNNTSTYGEKHEFNKAFVNVYKCVIIERRNENVMVFNQWVDKLIESAESIVRCEE